MSLTERDTYASGKGINESALENRKHGRGEEYEK